jgi:hypothetical protein
MEYTSVLNNFLSQLAESQENQLGKLLNISSLTIKQPDWFLSQNTRTDDTQNENAATLLKTPIAEIKNQAKFPGLNRQLIDLGNEIDAGLKLRPKDFQYNNALNLIKNGALVAFYDGNLPIANAYRLQVLEMLKNIKRTGRGRRTYRKPKRATSSLRTRRARHSGLSKRLKKRSSRKSRTGKWKTTTRY